MKGLLQVGELEAKMPLVYNWLKHTEATRELVEEHYSHLAKPEKLATLVAENVLTQIDNLKTYPSVRSHLHRNEVQLHGWIYNITDGSVLTYDRANHTFIPLSSNLEGNERQSSEPQADYSSDRLSQGQRDRIFRGSPAFYHR